MFNVQHSVKNVQTKIPVYLVVILIRLLHFAKIAKWDILKIVILTVKNVIKNVYSVKILTNVKYVKKIEI